MQRKLKQLRHRVRKSSQVRLKQFHRLRRRPVMIPVLFFVCLSVASAAVLLALNHGTPKFKPLNSYIVIISHDRRIQTVPTNEPTIGDLLKKLHIQLGSGDRVEPSVATAIKQDNLRVNIYRAVPIEVTDGSQVTYAVSAAATSRALVEQAGIKLYPEDVAQTLPPPASIIDGGIRKRITVQRSTPVVLNIYGTPALVRTQAKTVGELIGHTGVKLANGDRVQPSADTTLTPNMQVYLLHKGVEVVTEFQTVAMPTETVRDNSLSFGTIAVRQQGSPGQEAITYQIIKKDGKEVSRVQLQRVTIVQPVTQIIAQGQAVSIPADKQAVMAQAGVSPDDYKYVDYIASHEGAWCPTKIQGTHNCPGYMNPSDVPAYGGYGIFQATPGNKMASAGGDWATSAVTQIRWATGYAVGRYGSWGAAYQHKISTGWW